MMHRNHRTALVAVAVLVLLAAAVAAVRVTSKHHTQTLAGKLLQPETQGAENGGPGGEAADGLTAQQQFAEARTAPEGIVNPGAYSAAYSALTGLDRAGGSWLPVTNKPYDADDPEFRDYYSNSSGGSGNVTGRITGLAADDQGYVYAAGAAGGVWRSSTGGGSWAPIADALPSLSSGDLELNKADGSLWYATGEANTGGTSYVGSGVYRLANPRTGSFTPPSASSNGDRVGGDELESTTINSLRFTSDRVWAATLRGVWTMPLTATGAPAAAHWTLAFAPNPRYLPKSLQPYTSTQTLGGGCAGTATTQPGCPANAGYANIVNDVAVDPKDPTGRHVIAAVGWRSGPLSIGGTVIYYNGFYESRDGGVHWALVNPQGVIDSSDIGYVNFAYAADGAKLYAINQSPRLLNKLNGTVNSYLDGIFVSNTGNPAGPWSRVAESQKLAESGSALKQTTMGKGYGPGIQAWYNQFLVVDPTNADHLVAGLEEVYDTKNAGASWNTIGPYWNFTLTSNCWWLDAVYPPNTATGSTRNTCPQTTHPDQHSATVGTVNGVLTLFVGNDGGVYSRPLNSTAINANGNATDWKSLNDGTLDALQYYAVGVGSVPATPPEDRGKTTQFTGALGGSGSVIVSGGLQDNGGSIIRQGAAKMASNFGGDGGDVLVDPANGCNIVQEYVNLSMRVTNNCAQNKGMAFIDTSVATTYTIRPPEQKGARFIAPFAANKAAGLGNEWIAGGNSLWFQNHGFAIRSGSEWTAIYSLPLNAAARTYPTYTAVAMTGNTVAGGWCGPCNNSGFSSGVTVGTRSGSTWAFNNIATGAISGLPKRYVGGVAVAPDGTVYVSMNGFSRRFTEGEGAGFGHIFKLAPGDSTFTDISAGSSAATSFPDIPANSIQERNGALFVGTDLGVIYRAAGSSEWKRLGTGLPLTVALDVEIGPDGYLYAATHGRGIWRINVAGL
jgi:hypothetical protein